MSGTLGDFLGGKTEEEQPREPDVPREPEQQAAPEPEAKPEPEAAEPKTEGEPEPQPVQQAGRQVPVAALEAERRKRQEREAEAADLRRQLDEFKRQPQPQQQTQTQPEQTDEEKFFARVREEARQASYQTTREDRFYQSEMAAVRKYGAEAVQAAADQFLAVRKVAPQVQVELDSQPDPIGWLVEQSARVREVGEFVQNGEGFRAKIEAELRAKWEAENGGQQRQPPAPPLPRQQRSLANTRSSAPRAAIPYSGPTPLEDILPGTARR